MTVAKISGSLSYFLKIAWVILEPWVISKIMDTFNPKWLILSMKSKIFLEYMSILAILVSLEWEKPKTHPFFQFLFSNQTENLRYHEFFAENSLSYFEKSLSYFRPWVILPALKKSPSFQWNSVVYNRWIRGDFTKHLPTTKHNSLLPYFMPASDPMFFLMKNGLSKKGKNPPSLAK